MELLQPTMAKVIRSIPHKAVLKELHNPTPPMDSQPILTLRTVATKITWRFGLLILIKGKLNLSLKLQVKRILVRRLHECVAL